MTVKELIDYLKTQPQDYEVKIVKTYPDERDELKRNDERETLTRGEILTKDGQVIFWEEAPY